MGIGWDDRKHGGERGDSGDS